MTHAVQNLRIGGRNWLQLVTVAEAAQALRLHESSIRGYIRMGELPVARLASRAAGPATT